MSKKQQYRQAILLLKKIENHYNNYPKYCGNGVEYDIRYSERIKEWQEDLDDLQFKLKLYPPDVQKAARYYINAQNDDLADRATFSQGYFMNMLAWKRLNNRRN